MKSFGTVVYVYCLHGAFSKRTGLPTIDTGLSAIAQPDSEIAHLSLYLATPLLVTAMYGTVV